MYELLRNLASSCRNGLSLLAAAFTLLIFVSSLPILLITLLWLPQ